MLRAWSRSAVRRVLRERESRSAAAEVVSGEGVLGLCGDLRRRAAEDEFAAVFAAPGADVDEVVGGADDGFLVLDDEEGVALVAEAVHDVDEASDVARVEADAGFVEDEERVDQGGAEAGGEVDALDFAAARACGSGGRG